MKQYPSALLAIVLTLASYPNPTFASTRMHPEETQQLKKEHVQIQKKDSINSPTDGLDNHQTRYRYLYYGEILTSGQVNAMMNERDLHFVSFNRPIGNIYATVWNTTEEAKVQATKPQAPSPKLRMQTRGGMKTICTPAHRTTRLYNVPNCNSPSNMQSFAHSLKGTTANTRIRVKNDSIAVRQPLNDCPAPKFTVWSRTNGTGSSAFSHRVTPEITAISCFTLNQELDPANQHE